MKNAVLLQINSGEFTSSDRKLAKDIISKAASDSVLSLMLQRVMANHDRGIGIDIFANDAELTPNEAADILKMSRPHLLTFMNNGDLPFHYVGKSQTHRKIKMSDLKEFMAARERGQEILANALDDSPLTEYEECLLSQREIDELNSL